MVELVLLFAREPSFEDHRIFIPSSFVSFDFKGGGKGFVLRSVYWV